MAVSGSYKVAFSPDLSSFKGIGDDLRKDLAKATRGLPADFDKMLKQIQQDMKKLSDKLNAEDIIDKDSFDDEGKKAGEEFTDALDKEVESKGKGIGGKLSGILGGAAKLAGAAALAGGAALGATAAASVKAYADFEQFVGGVDKLFGDSSGKVQGYAAKAFATAGISANDYMETVTSFSASLISGLGGDTAKAADLADMAITDMSDNANTFGTDMATLQNTYQGFAKGNFGMLDNLKLGYGGTQEEMARLLNESGKLNEGFVATAQNVKDIPFATMIEAINATQERLGIMGTTAKEGSETIAGSFNQMTAGWQNVVTGFAVGGDFLDNALEGFAESIGFFVSNVLEILPQVISGIGEAVTTLMPVLIETVSALIPQLANLLVTALPQLFLTIIEALPELFSLLIQAATDLLPMLLQLVVDITLALVNMLPEMILQLVDFLIASIPVIIEAGLQLLGGLLEAIPVILVKLVEALPKIILAIVDTLISFIPVLGEQSLMIFMALVNAIPKILPALASALPQIILAIIKLLVMGIPMLIKAGADLMAGLMKGFASFDFMKVIRDVGNSWMKGIKNFFGIHSPSVLLKEEIGINLGLGVGEGVKDSTPEVLTDVDAFNKRILDGFATDIDANVNVSGDGQRSGGTTVIQNITAQKPTSIAEVTRAERRGILSGLAAAK